MQVVHIYILRFLLALSLICGYFCSVPNGDMAIMEIDSSIPHVIQCSDHSYAHHGETAITSENGPLKNIQIVNIISCDITLAQPFYSSNNGFGYSQKQYTKSTDKDIPSTLIEIKPDPPQSSIG